MSSLINEESEYYSQVFASLDLSDQELVSKEFEDCTFKECNFSSAILRSCKFIDCHFAKCNLSNAKLAYSRFNEVVFDECKMIGVDWTRAYWPNLTLSAPIKFTQCILNDSSFFGLGLDEMVIEGCKAHDVDFREGKFKGADFSYTDFSNSLFNNTNLSAADFTEASNYSIDIHSNAIRGAKFSRSEAVSLLDSLGIELVD